MTFFNIDDCINFNYNYESLHSCLLSQLSLNKNKFNSNPSRAEDLVPITFGKLIPTGINDTRQKK